MDLATSIQYLKGVGPRRAAELRRVGIQTLEDFLYRFPFRYEDRSHFLQVAQLKPDHTVSLLVQVVSFGIRRTRRPGFKIFELLAQDATGFIRAVWFNQPFLRDIFAVRQQVVLFGRAELGADGGLQLTNPDYEIIDDDETSTIHTGRIVPVYEKIGPVTSKLQRRLVHEALRDLPSDLADPVPKDVLQRLDLPSRATALAETHFPLHGTNLDELNAFRTRAQQRLIFEEFFLFQLGLLLKRKASAAERKSFVIHVDDQLRRAARSVLPFPLTADQKQALKEIVLDMERPTPMNRLLQGDVGAGKTIVALLAALVALENGLQVAFMAPTEILAEQHSYNVRRLLASSRYTIGTLTAGRKAGERRATLAGLARGDIHLVLGTHALVQETVEFARLGLVIIDEQHRFGVIQRAQLRAKGWRPDVLVMTATPIPRTLALTIHGDLDVSTIRHMPPGRRPVKTLVKPESRRSDIHEFVKAQLDEGRQAYVVYPLIEESSKIDLRAATAMADHLAHEVFPAYRVALLHGRMKPDAKEQIMTRFSKGELDVLVATTVIEVGIDIPNATVMIIEHAERFGLAQLHQLRGRVGRGGQSSYCILMYQAPLSADARRRLKTMAETTDGFLIAERDLELRGPGDFVGTRQSGMPMLRIGDLQRDHHVLEAARREAAEWMQQPGSDRRLLTYVKDTWAERFGLIGVG